MYPRFESASHSEYANELNHFFSGRAAKTLIESRQKPWDQSPDLHMTTDEFIQSNGRWDGFGIVYANSRILSLVYEVGWYGAGAAHTNSHFETYNFLMQDRLLNLSLEDFFKDYPSAIVRISDLCIKALCREHWSRTGTKPNDDDLKWFRDGAGANAENFTDFTVDADHFTFLFEPYKVSCYAMGRWSVDISFYDLLDLLHTDGLHLLAAPSRA